MPAAGTVVHSVRANLSLRLRLILAGVPVFVLALAVVGMAVDHAFREAALVATHERLESALYLVLAGIEVDAEGVPGLADPLAETRLEQPRSGLYAGILGSRRSWQSSSLLGLQNMPPAERLERGRSSRRGPEETDGWFMQAMGLGWELESGRIVDITVWAAEDQDLYRASVRSFREGLWRWLALAAALVIGAQVFIIAVALRPLRRVADEVRAVEQGGREGLEGAYPEELLPLTANLNAVLATERANAARYQRALGDLAHALKTPLAVMRAALERDRAPPGGDLQSVLEDMEHIVRHQLDKAARSTRRTMLKPVPVGPVLRRLVSGLERLYRRQAVRFQCVVEGEPTALMAERELMELAGNLLENAARYGGGKVRILVRAGAPGPRHAGLELVVDDDGPGIDKARWPALLQRGVRGDERVEGHGLGLAIVQDIVAAHGGELMLERADWGGARIRVMLPPR